MEQDFLVGVNLEIDTNSYITMGSQIEDKENDLPQIFMTENRDTDANGMPMTELIVEICGYIFSLGSKFTPGVQH